jgi:succinyl-CoA synthetase beta subunit
MNLHEYQAKEILKTYGVRIQEGSVAQTVDEALAVARNSPDVGMWVIKAQIHAGGRGKGGGVKLAKSLNDVEEISRNMLGMNLVTHQTGPKGRIVKRILIANDVYYPGETPTREFYISILLNRLTGRNIIMYSPQGGMDIEQVAEQTPHLIFKEEIDPATGLMPYQCRKIGFNLGLSDKSLKEMTIFIRNLYDAYCGSDASLLEINPVLKTSDNLILAVDAKMVVDDNALYRQPVILTMRDLDEEAPAEVEASNNNLNFVKLDGNVGCMVNGAGLAMATMDIIKLSGGEPANFLDVGGGANPRTVEAGLKIILSDENVKAILINIFGGIVRCDRVANGVVEAYKNVGDISVPVIVRLQGTNAQLGREIIESSGLKVFPATTLSEASELVSKCLSHN